MRQKVTVVASVTYLPSKADKQIVLASGLTIAQAEWLIGVFEKIPALTQAVHSGDFGIDTENVKE